MACIQRDEIHLFFVQFSCLFFYDSFYENCFERIYQTDQSPVDRSEKKMKEEEGRRRGEGGEKEEREENESAER